MGMKKIIICSIAVLSFAFAKAQQTKSWTLQECVNYAIENNINIKQADLNIEQAQLDKKDALGAFLPSLNASASNSWNTGLTQNVVTGVLQTQTTRNSSYGINSGVTLFNGMRNAYRHQRAKMNILATQYSAEQLEDNILLNVANSYLNVLFNKENLKQLETQHQLTAKQLEQTQQLVDAGSLPRGDVLEVQATFANEEQQILAAQNNVVISRITLAQILNLDDFKNFDVADPDLSDPSALILDQGADGIYDAATKNRFEIKIAEQNTALAEQDLKIAKGARLPTVNAFFNYNTRESDRLNLAFFDQLSLNDGISYGLSLNLPIFNGWSVSNNVKRSKLNVENNRLQETQAKLDLKQNIYQAYNDAQGSRLTYQSAQKALEARELAYEYAQERYNVGLMNAFDFNQSQTQLTNAQSSLLRSKYDYIFKLKVLELFTGIAPEDLKL
ncbi:transporter [Nonlabens ulvanivorans]|uniref:Outer membrane protein n=2 Tax=Flavobacteriaceae TaxID=49546 RepID=A0A081D6H3_NONUL|nr:transporter [Nonlabens ulvanivorans]PRX15481.1 outer membrane protein [Nonlabens ulvanivorans]GAK74519.1 RND efflux system [Nonlabens ulvanivorans]GAK98381.1 RND efflux system outer membrane lipoprotein CmeC [Nonlabens ulvanivorans]